MEADTESLRAAAPQWSLAGDQQLLGVLQNIHERLVSRCQQTNRRLGEMASALDDASIDLQNVNNKFMALSNSQFIESRVYDDDADVAPAEVKTQPQKPTESIPEVDQIKLGLKVLEDMHEPLMILDSDSETDSDEETSRMVLKPKDLYEDRPLPYIIGSYAWQSKWHAGLIPEDSDSDSSVKREPWEREYSESEPEISKPDEEQENSSDISSQLSTGQGVTVAKPVPNFVEQLARHEISEPPKSDLHPEEVLPQTSTVRKVYRPEKPAISNIFSDEPPPIDQSYQSYHSDDDDEGDIFAELRKNQPYTQRNRVQSNITDELFGKKSDGIFSDYRGPPPPVNQKSPLFSVESEPELFEQPPPLPKTEVVADNNVKKPVGGISLFGNKGTESIGAAILKRNQRQSSTDEDLSEDISQKQEKDIFDHLFAKSEKEQRNVEKKVEKEVKVDKKVDLFSDNLFDDIDDIFTTNIPKVPLKPAEKNQKSLFDEDDDLFSDVAVAKSKYESVKDSKDNKKSIFDSDDDLFSDKVEENIQTKDTGKIKDNSEAKKGRSVKSESKKSIFDSDDDLFTDKVEENIQTKDTGKIQDNSEAKKEISVKSESKKSIFDSDDDLFTDKVEENIQTKDTGKIQDNSEAKKEISVKSESKKSIFDSDDDFFTDKADKIHVNQSVANDKSIESKDNSEFKKEMGVQSDSKKSIFDSDDELFSDKSDKIPQNQSIQNDTITSETNSKFESNIFSENAGKKPEEVSINSVVEENTQLVKDDLNDKNQIQVENRKITPIPVVDTKKVSLFDDDEEELFNTESSTRDVFKNATESSKPTSSLFPNISVEKTNKSIFDDESETRNINVILDKNTDSSTKENKAGIKTSLFEEDSEDDLFSDKPKQVTSKTNEASKSIEKLINAFEDDDDLFKDTIVKKTSHKIEQTLKTEIKDEIVKEIKDEMRSGIKDEINTELKDNVLKDKKDSEVGDYDKPVKSALFNDEDNFLKGSISNDKLAAKDKIETITNSTDEVDDELFSNSSTINESKLENSEPPVESEVTTSKSNQLNEQHIEKPPLFNEAKQSLFDNPDEFSDIFIEPPKFEKPKEPKRSKNVNALFDDDSDDEALFFKKTDPTLDEKPEFESPTSENRIFGIFHDEPPDLDIDFVQKSNVQTKNESSTVVSDTESSTFNIPTSESTNTSKDRNLAPKPLVVKNYEAIKSLENKGKDYSNNESDIKLDSDKTDNTPKPIGKLKNMNFNINVNALLPGASPKKVKTTEQIDGNTQTKSSEDISDKNTQEVEPKMVKSISFEGKPDSQVLDNKLSKDRPRIQVKRRPSTRRARKEAVRKSGIDFGDDSTDNSSSIDDQPKVTKKESRKVDDVSTTQQLTTFDDENISQPTENVITSPRDEEKRTKTEEKTQNKDINEENINIDDEEVLKSTNEVTSNNKTEELIIDNRVQENIKVKTTDDSLLQKTEVTTKTVYILNDEDIFSVEKPKKILNIVEDDIPGISTLGKVYKEPENKSNSDSDDDLFRNVSAKSKSVKSDTIGSGAKLLKSEIVTKLTTKDSDDKLFQPQSKDKIQDKNAIKNIFNDEDTNEDVDENLFKPETNIKKNNKSVFDLSDDEDLFSENKSKDVSREVFKKEVKKVDVKTSLFGDEDDDDDLFGSRKTKKADTSSSSSSQSNRAKDIVAKSSEPVFEDPLSLLGADDD